MNERIFRLMFFLASCGPLATCAQNAGDRKRLEEFRAIVNSPVVLPVKGPYTVKASTEITYSKTSSRKLDVYQPANAMAAQKFPLVIFIHGKTPIETDPRTWNGYVTWANLVAGKGFVALTFTHSLAIPGQTLDAAAKDLDDVLQYAKSNYARFNIDTTRVALMGYSAGVVLLPHVFAQPTLSPRCLVAFYGFMDIAGAALFKGEPDAAVQKFSMVNHVAQNNFPPLFLARAGKESNPTLNSTIDTFLTKATTLNLPVTFVNHPAGVHGFDTLTPDSRSREIVTAVLAFLENHLQ